MEGLGRYPRIALAGCGYWGKNLARNFHALGVLAAIVDPSPEGKSNAARMAPGAEVVDSIDSVLNDPSIEALALATPAPTHTPLALAAFAAGKHVFVEKPLATSVTDGEAMVAAAAATERVLMVGHILEYHPAVEALDALFRTGQLGELRQLYSQRLNLGKVRTAENVLWSFAPHDLSLFLRFAGEEPVEVNAFGEAWLSTGVEDFAVVTFRFPSGPRAHLFVNWLNPFKRQEFVLIGSEAMAVFDDTASDGKLKLYRHRVEGLPTAPHATKAEPEVIPLPDGEPLRNECIHFLEAVRDGRQPLTKGERGLAVLRLLRACDASLGNESPSPYC